MAFQALVAGGGGGGCAAIVTVTLAFRVRPRPVPEKARVYVPRGVAPVVVMPIMVDPAVDDAEKLALSPAGHDP